MRVSAAPLVAALSLLLLVEGSALAQDRPIVAVFDIEVRGPKFDVETRSRLTDYLGSLLASKGFQVVPRSQLKERLVEAKKASYKECYDESCQIEVGKELAAQKTMSSQVLKLGKKCKVTVNLFDLKRAASEGAGTASGDCGEDEVVESLEKAVVNLFAGVGAPPPKLASAQPADSGYAALAEQAAGEQKRRQADLAGAWQEVSEVAANKDMAHKARALVVRKFLDDFPEDNPHEADARNLLLRLDNNEDPSGGTAGMVHIPAGEFLMGCSPGDENCGPDEKPSHKVWLSEYWIDATEVTVEAYAKCRRCRPPQQGENEGCTWKVAGKEQHPVNCVDWSQARGYCAWAGKRLPTEAEWENAARGDTTGVIYGSIDQVAWDERNSNGGTHPVKQKQANAFGLYDMLGNVWEWCADWHSSTYYKKSPEQNPAGPQNGAYRVLRGGSWGPGTWDGRVSNRGRRDPSFGLSDTGFRCVLSTVPRP